MNPATISNTLLQISKVVQYEKYGHLASGSIILYDYLITFGQEVDLIWSERWSVVKALLLANRYYGLTSVIYDYYGEKGSSVEDRHALNANRPFFSYHCYKGKSFPVWQGVTNIVVTVLAQGILQLRIYALYPDNKRVLSLMVSTFMVSTAASSVLTWRIISAVPGEQLISLPGGQFCIIERPPLKYSQVFFVPMFLFEALLFFLAAIKGYYNLKRKPFGRFLFHRRLPRLADVLFRDSVIYFAAIGATHITCFLIWTFFPNLSSIPLAFAVAFPCVLANRLVLNLRATARARAELMMNIDGETEEVLGFDSRERVTGPIVFALSSDS